MSNVFSPYRFLFTSEVWGKENKQIDAMLALHAQEEYCEYSENFTTLAYVSSMNTLSPKDQFLVFSSISNYHKHGYPSVHVPSSIIQPTHINYVEHGLYDPFAKENLEGNYIWKYILQSPRNHIMYFLSTSQETENYHLIKHCLQKDSPSATNINIDVSDEYVPRPKK